MTKPRKKRSKQPQPDDAPDRRPTADRREKRTSDERESGTGTMTSKQTDRHPQPQIDISPRIPRPGGRGNKSKQAN